MPHVSMASSIHAPNKKPAEAGFFGGIHCLRHTFCSHLVQAGVPLRTFQVLASHSPIKITQNYAHHSPSTLRARIIGLSL